MKRIVCQILGSWVMVFLIAANNVALADDKPGDEVGSFCLDSMQTVPIADDLVPTPVAVDGGCMVSEAVIAI
jgi:hypothetical protein